MTGLSLLLSRNKKWVDAAARLALATVGAYLVAALAARDLALFLPMAPLDATAAALMLAFILSCPLAFWAFVAPSLRSAFASFALIGTILFAAGA